MPKVREEIFDQALDGEISPVILPLDKGAHHIGFNIDQCEPSAETIPAVKNICYVLAASGIQNFYVQNSGMRGNNVIIFLERPLEYSKIQAFGDSVLRIIEAKSGVAVTVLPTRSQNFRTIASLHMVTGRRARPLNQEYAEVSSDEEMVGSILRIRPVSVEDIKRAQLFLDRMTDFIPPPEDEHVRFENLGRCNQIDQIRKKALRGTKLSTDEVQVLCLLSHHLGCQAEAEKFLTGVDGFKGVTPEDIFPCNAALKLPPSCAAVATQLKEACGLCEARNHSMSPVHLCTRIISLPEGVIIPRCYRLNRLGVSKQIIRDGEPQWIPICVTPLYVGKKTTNLESGTVGSQLEFHYDGTTKTMNVAQSQIASVQKITELSDHGLPVTCNNAGDIIDYLSTQRHASLNTIPEQKTCRSSGWINLDSRTHIFVWGNKIISPDPSLDIEREQNLEHAKVFAFMRPGGSHEKWCGAIRVCLNYPIPTFSLGLAFASPLLELVNAINFSFSVWGHSTGGKTTALKVALSVFGLPTKDGLLLTWMATLVGIEGRATIFNGLVMPLDDNSQTSTDNIFKDVTYMLANGVSKQRGGRSGDAKPTHTYKLISFGTGERPTTGSNSFMGQNVRVIETSALPFGEQTPETGKIVQELNDILDKNYGHAGERYLKEVVAIANDPVRLEELRQDYQKYREELAKEIEDQYLLRTVGNFAVVKLGLKLAAGIFPELQIQDKNIDAAISTVFENQKSALNAKSNVDVRAVRYVWNRILSEPQRFKDDEREMWGREVKRRDNGACGFGVLPAKLEEILREGKFSPNACMSYFKSEGWVWLDNDQLWSVSFPGGTMRVYVFDKQKAIDAGILSENATAAQNTEPQTDPAKDRYTR